jgi:hypothetical protein
MMAAVVGGANGHPVEHLVATVGPFDASVLVRCDRDVLDRRTIVPLLGHLAGVGEGEKPGYRNGYRTGKV